MASAPLATAARAHSMLPAGERSSGRWVEAGEGMNADDAPCRWRGQGGLLKYEERQAKDSFLRARRSGSQRPHLAEDGFLDFPHGGEALGTLVVVPVQMEQA